MPGKSLDDRQEACRIDGLFEPNHIAKLRWCVRPMRKARGDDDGDAAPKQGLGEVGAGPVRELEVENGKLSRPVGGAHPGASAASLGAAPLARAERVMKFQEAFHAHARTLAANT